jgi:hypothetical protein
MWTDLLRERDPIGFNLHSQKPQLADQYIEALENGNMQIVVDIVNRYVDIRDELCIRWAECVVNGGKRDWLTCLNNEEKMVIALYGLSEAEQEIIKNDIAHTQDKQQRQQKLNDYAFQNLKRLLDKRISLYSDTAKDLIEAARKENIAIMPLGAGGPGAVLIAISVEPDVLEKFLESQGLTELEEEDIERIINGTGILRGYVPFRISNEPIKIEGFGQLPGVVVPKILSSDYYWYDEDYGKFAPGECPVF